MIEGLRLARLSPGGQIKDVRADHVARYKWAAERVDGHVIDAGCNCGYGSAILTDWGQAYWWASSVRVTAIDNWPAGLDFARDNWSRPGIDWILADFEGEFVFPPADAVVAFEIIEHLADPRPLLIEARRVAGRLFASVPNEAVWPWEPRLYPTHQRHYTRKQFSALLMGCGWSEIYWFGQVGGDSPVETDVKGRTIVVECR